MAAEHSPKKTHVLFVCMGNICRSPTAEAVFRQRAGRAGLEQLLVIDSAGTHGSHQGEPPDTRAISVARSRGYDLTGIRSRPLVQSDFERFDYMLGMDNYNLHFMRAMQPGGCVAYVGRLLDFAPHLGIEEIDDPYYGGARHFDTVLAQIEAGADGLLAEIRKRITLR
jgi:protein-tyrosine phosphatase